MMKKRFMKLVSTVLVFSMLMSGETMAAAASSVSGNGVEENNENVVTGEEEKENIPGEEAEDETEEALKPDFNYSLTYHEVDDPVPVLSSSEEAAYALRGGILAYYSSVEAGKVPALRDQGIYGTCWAFSAIGACESGLISKGLAGMDIDLSERQLAYYFYQKGTTGDLLNGTWGDYNSPVNYSYLQQGGNALFTMWHLASWAGIVDESAAPYEGVATALPVTSQNVYGTDSYHLQNAYIVNKENTDIIKQMIMEYGSMAVAYYSSGSYKYDDPEHDSYYYYQEGASTNHAVQVVGWDNNFSKENFATTPPGDGAWLIKNSWGEESADYAQNGYFWISYYDTSLSGNFFAFLCEPGDNYDNIYQYDGASGNRYINTKYAANVYTAKGNEGGAETIEAVGLGCYSNGTDYTVSIYTGLTDENDPTSGELVSSQTGTLAYSGYHTIPLDEPVYVEEGEKFSVVFSFPDQTALYVDYTYNAGWINFTTDELDKTSFCKMWYYYAQWMDAKEWASSTFRIKAYTSNELKKLKRPVVAAESIDFDQIRLSWNSVKNAEGYMIYRGTDQAQLESNIAQDNVYAVQDASSKAKQEYVDTVLSNVTYYYAVLPYAEGYDNVKEESISSYVSAKAEIKIPAISSVANQSDGTIKITWAKVSSNGYELWRSTTGNEGSYENIGSLGKDTLSYIDQDVISGRTYYYYLTAKGAGCQSDPSPVMGMKALDTAEAEVLMLGYNKLQISWKEIDGAKQYYIYRNTSSSGSFKQIAVVDGNSYIDSTVVTGTTYYYKVKAFGTMNDAVSGKEVTVSSPQSKPVSGKPAPQKVILKSVSSSGHNALKIMWNQVEGADGYYIYRSTEENGEYRYLNKIDGGNNLSYSNTGILTGTTYYYKVCAYKTVNGTNISGMLSESLGGIPVPARTGFSSVLSGGYDSINLEWYKVTGATGYHIYRGESEEELNRNISMKNPAIDISQGTQTQYTDTGLKTGITYYYAVEAYKTMGDQKVAGKVSVVSYGTPFLAAPQIKSVSNMNNLLSVKWESSSEADGYVIYRSEAEEPDQFEEIKRVEGGTTDNYNDEEIVQGQTYYYQIAAYKGSKVVSAVSETMGMKALKTAEANVVSLGSNQLRITWDEVEGADSYYIYRNTTPSGSYRQIGITNGTGYTDNAVETGTTYYYKVKAYGTMEDAVSNETLTVSSPQSAAVSAVPVPEQAVLKSVSGAGYNALKITWNAVAGADGYYIYRSTEENGEYRYLNKINGGNNLSYSNTGILTGTTYYYKVCAYKTVNGTNISGILSESLSGTPVPARTGFSLAVSGGYEKVNLEWYKVTGATGYFIYRGESEEELEKNIAAGNPAIDVTDGTVTRITDENLKTGTEYIYVIAAYRTMNGEKISGRVSDSKKCTPVLEAPQLKSVSNINEVLRLQWTQVSEAKGYIIYRSDHGAEGTFEEIERITGNGTVSYDDGDVVSGREYYYRIAAYADNGVTSDAGAIMGMKALGTVEAKVYTKEYYSLQVYWEKIDGADRYYIYRNTVPTGSFKQIAITDNNLYIDDTLEMGTTYYYKVKAFGTMDDLSGENEILISSPQSEAVSGTPVPGIPFINSILDLNNSSAQVNWTAVEGADGYEVYRSKNETGNDVRLTTITSGATVSYTNKGMPAGDCFYYRIRAYKMLGTTKVYGPYSNYVKFIP